MKALITIFYCVNGFEQGVFTPITTNVEFKLIKLPCSAMIKDVFLLRAFEAGAESVLVIGCPPGKCKRIDGNIRAKKRVEWTKSLLNEIGLDGNKLLFATSDQALAAITELLEKQQTQTIST